MEHTSISRKRVNDLVDAIIDAADKTQAGLAVDSRVATAEFLLALSDVLGEALNIEFGHDRNEVRKAFLACAGFIASRFGAEISTASLTTNN